MQLLKNEKAINIMEKTLNYVDSRLIDHGKRVAYLLFTILEPQHKFDNKQLRDICLLAMLHDVGAYKTEEIDRMVIFETIDVWDHSIYGYLFLKYFSPLEELAPIILFHHAECDKITHLDSTRQMLAQLVSLCDRADFFVMHNGDNAGFQDHINQCRNIKYRDDIVDMFLASGINIDSIFENMDSDEVFNRVFRETPLTEDEAANYIKMIVSSIDFRSSQTVIHTVAVTCIAGLLARLLGASENDIEKVKTGALLHDVGKVGIPVHIIESAGKLSDADMEVMRGHVSITEKILEGNVDSDIIHIAVKHHEKLNGTGYPKKLKNHDISFLDRVLSIADIFSALCGARSYKNVYSKKRVVDILRKMSAQNLLDSEIALLTITHFEEIMEAMKMESLPVIQTYNAMNEEYLRIRDKIGTNGKR